MGHRVDPVDARQRHPTLLAALHQEQVFEAASDEEPRPAPGTGQERIEHGRRAIANHLEVREERLDGQSGGVSRLAQRGHEAFGDRAWSAGRLPEDEIAVLVDHETVGEGSADVRIAEDWASLSLC